MIVDWIIAVIVTVILNVAAYIITPKPKQPKPAAVEQAQYPTASAGKPVPKVWGTMTVKSVNVLGYWDTATSQYQIKV